MPRLPQILPTYINRQQKHNNWRDSPQSHIEIVTTKKFGQAYWHRRKQSNNDIQNYKAPNTLGIDKPFHRKINRKKTRCIFVKSVSL